MGGAESKMGKGWINYDLKAPKGIKDDIANFSKHFGAASVSEMVVNNPRASFLAHITEALKKDGTVTIRGQIANRYFKEIWNGTAKGMENFEVVPGSKKTGLSIEGHTNSNGTQLRGDANSLNEIILKKKT
jgi:hypothetical protein